MKQHELSGGTVRLFDEDAYLSSFDAVVLSCQPNDSGSYCIILDRTAFFPEAGGQPADTGVLTVKDSGETAEIFQVTEKEGRLLHFSRSPVKTGPVTGTIDFRQRYERMRNHSGEHLLSGFAHRLFGCTNVGFHLNDEAVTVDFDRQLSREQLLELEQAVNEVIAENVPITARFPSAEELAAMDYRSKLELTENVRIVEIGDSDCLYDRCACCAPHVASTTEIGSLLITDSLNYKGGTRLTMVCGKNACRAARSALSNVRAIAAMLSAKPEEAAAAAEHFIERTNEDKARFSALCSTYIDMRAAQISSEEENVLLFEPQLDRNALRRLVDKAADICSGIAAGFCGSDEEGWTYIIISRSCDLKAESKRLNEKMNGRGGGSAQMIQGTARATRAVLEQLFS